MSRQPGLECEPTCLFSLACSTHVTPYTEKYSPRETILLLRTKNQDRQLEAGHSVRPRMPCVADPMNDLISVIFMLVLDTSWFVPARGRTACLDRRPKLHALA
jgi:hypothetical protein